MLLPFPTRPLPSAARTDLRRSYPSPSPFFSYSGWSGKQLCLKPALASSSEEHPHNIGFSLSVSSFSSALSSRLWDALLWLLFFAGILGARSFLGLLPLDFPDRWRRLHASAEAAEFECREIPRHLIQAIVASEDRRFFSHFGVDPVGVSRAVVYFPRAGGGSTITQQLVKNVFLKNERKFSRKVMEIILALILERKMPKQRILCSYLTKIYCGHGKYGIKSASIFYFGKQPSLLNMGECAMLAGMLPSPEVLSPFNHPSRGKLPQARALRKMAESGFIDMKVALHVANQTLCLHGDEADNVSQYAGNQTRESSVIDEIWDWENASRGWEATEYLESWAMRIHK